LFSILFNFVVGTLLYGKFKSTKANKPLLIFGITINLLLLGYFKYAEFFIKNISEFFNLNFSSLNIVMPLAISFFTFQQIAYLVDSYKGEIKKYDFLNYALFVSFFPQLIAGPIVHHKEMMPQFLFLRNLTVCYKNIAKGLFLFFVGLFKKIVIADTFSEWATSGFDEATILTFAEGWATSLSFTFQLYFDFSGYTDMALGIALLFNIKLPINFNSPYQATNIQEFWRRWHITLTRFLKDYVYIPLGGNRKSHLRIHGNILATFFLCGLWHGAGWTFIFWGIIHGVAMQVHRIWKDIGFKMNKYLAGIITFNFVNISWVFFRAEEWKDAVKVLRGMFGLEGVVVTDDLVEALPFLLDYGFYVGDHLINMFANDDVFRMLFVFSLITFFFKNSNQNRKDFRMNSTTLAFAIFTLAVSVLSLNKISPFLYFNF
jgi:alginate O-acetyltransferase complex protein AlgI